MELNYLLSAKGIDTTKQKVLVMRHVPQEPELRKALPWLAAERPEVFNAYQQTQRSKKVEKMLTRAAYLVSCIGVSSKPDEALFVGVYTVNGNQRRSVEDLLKNLANQTLQELGGKVFFGGVSDKLWFDLELENIYQEWKGKLILGWRAPIAFAQWLAPEKCPFKAILEESILDKAMPPWN